VIDQQTNAERMEIVGIDDLESSLTSHSSQGSSADDLNFMLHDMEARCEAISYELNRRNNLPKKIILQHYH
jgi:hypothetical protein